MPINKCKKGNRKGYKFGKRGKCYIGEGGRKAAARQGRAIKSRGGK
jgi:hypothetical protein